MARGGKDSDKFTSHLKIWDVALSETNGFEGRVWKEIALDTESTIIRPAKFLQKIDPKVWSPVAAAIAVLIAIPLADLSASKQNRVRLENGKQRYVESIVPLFSTADSSSLR